MGRSKYLTHEKQAALDRVMDKTLAHPQEFRLLWSWDLSKDVADLSFVGIQKAWKARLDDMVDEGKAIKIRRGTWKIL